MELVSRSDDSGIAILSLNRPDMLNALSPSLFNELRAHIDAIAEQTETVGCVILRVRDGHFLRVTISKPFSRAKGRPLRIFRPKHLMRLSACPSR